VPVIHRDDTGAVLESALTHGMDLVLANKLPLAGRRLASESLWQTARARGRRILHEATVGAGLPIIDTYHKLTESGDRVERIEGLLSGTLGYVRPRRGCRSPGRCARRCSGATPSPTRGTICRGWTSAAKPASWRGCWGTRASWEERGVAVRGPGPSRDEFLARLDELMPGGGSLRAETPARQR
jgi:aspartokinase/homoserine dehydrogenase 1